MSGDLALPKRPRGKMGSAGQAQYDRQRAAFCAAILGIRQTLDFAVSARGWCYILEEFGLFKGDFDAAEKLINDCRKSGELPLDIAAEDGARRFANLESVHEETPEEMASGVLRYVRNAQLYYRPVSFWDYQANYVEMLVEKIDLKSLFEPVCREFNIPIANARGSADINSRASMMKRFAANEAKGRTCVLLYAGDHDPAGLRISDLLRKNLEDLTPAVGWSPDRLVIDRFGLNADFIFDQGLTWIDNLETGSGGRLDDPRHADHGKAYVQDYLAAYGARKVEANALVTRPQAGRQLCLDAILKYVDDDAAVDQWSAAIEERQAEMKLAISRLIAEESA